jgi:hypothetical protein
MAGVIANDFTYDRMNCRSFNMKRGTGENSHDRGNNQ